jgi:hypothetical protein
MAMAMTIGNIGQTGPMLHSNYLAMVAAHLISGSRH